MQSISKTNDNADDKLIALSLQYKCPYDWKKMKGDDRTRFCQSCEKNVYNISNMSRQEAVELIQEKEGDLCVRFYQRRDGTVITNDCTAILGLHRLRRRYKWFAIINASLAFFANALVPILGPALVTIVQGIGPIMESPTEINVSEVDPANIGPPPEMGGNEDSPS